MLKSMTAYGRASKTTPIGQFTVEIQSVNRKHLDIQLTLPEDFQRLDPEMRKLVSSLILRGQVTIKTYVYFKDEYPFQIKVNLPLAKQLKSAWEEMAKQLSLKEPTTLEMFSTYPNILIKEQEWDKIDESDAILMQVLEQALTELIAMREKEGAVLQTEIKERFANLNKYIAQIAEYAPGTIEKYRQKLMQRIEQLLPNTVENEEKLIREVALFAEKVNIDEEITRFRSHIDQANELLESDRSGLGKTFEFLLQELNREINTIGSKAQEIDVSKLVIEAKGELEKIREQMQNIE